MEVVIILVVIALAFAIPIYIGISNNKKYNQELEQNNALAIENKAIHLSGLPATGREVCSLMIKNNNIIIKNTRQEFNISMNKIVGAVVSQETRDVQTVKTTTKKNQVLARLSLEAPYLDLQELS